MANQPTKYRKFVVGAASAALVASAVAPVASAKDFSDTKGNTHEPAIDALSDAGIITGYPDGSFQPNKTLTRSDVVKLMGKWLVNAQGYEVPSDYKTNPRFADLTSASNDELLKYAAVVKDNGVFVGTPDGKLDPAGNITRENMAIVLVRAFDRVHNIDLATYVAGQDFKKDVTDRSSAKAEARPAIDVLDFFDITNPAAPAFNPKGTTTRGHFATFLHKSINTDFSDVATGVVGDVAVKAVNATTVEVTFKDAVENVNSLNFTIEGLTVSNAAVKQSDNKTVVLTTAVQEGGKEYTVSLNSKEIGKFKGVSAVIPTSIKITTQSVQGKVGQQAIVSADVGVKQAGIPVTFNVKADTNNTLNKDQVFESLTNEDGIATFSYTQYAAGRDSVVAYPTGAPTVRSLGYVFWGVDTILSIEEVTEGATINNGANKTYKVTYKHPETGLPVSNQTFNVGFLENMNVTSDKVANASVNGVKALQLANGTSLEAAQITTDSKGQATFTVSGVNAAVTPVVYALNTTSGESNKAYKASALQTSAAKVTFGAVQAEYKIEMTREGGEVAAINAPNGREYKIVVKDKEGKVAKNEVVNVAFNEDLDRVISTNTQAKFVDTDNDVYYPTTPVNGMSAKQISVKTNDKGEATFVISSDLENDYATPIAWIDINTSDAKQGNLDEGEPTAVGAISYFQKAYLDGAAIKAYKSTNLDKAVTAFDGDETAVFAAELVNQSGKKMPNIPVKKATYTVFNTGANDIQVGNEVISPNRSYTVTYDATLSSNGTVVTPAKNLEVVSIGGKTTSVRVIATGIAVNTDGKDFAFTAKEATATFTATDEVPNNYTGVIEAINTANQQLKFTGKKAVSIKGAKFFGLNGAELADFDAFVTELKASTGGVVATYLKDSEGKVTVKIVRTNTSDASVKFDEKSATLSSVAITKQPVVGTPSTPATATVTFTDIDAIGNEVTVNGLVYKFEAGATATETGYYKDAADLVAKINAAGKDVKAAVASGIITLTGKADGTEFTYKVNANPAVTANNGTKGVASNNQQLTITFSSAINAEVGDVATINGGSTTAKVKSVDGKKVVIELDDTVAPLTSGTAVTSITVGTNNAITVPTGTDTVRITNAF